MGIACLRACSRSPRSNMSIVFSRNSACFWPMTCPSRDAINARSEPAQSALKPQEPSDLSRGAPENPDWPDPEPNRFRIPLAASPSTVAASPAAPFTKIPRRLATAFAMSAADPLPTAPGPPSFDPLLRLLRTSRCSGEADAPVSAMRASIFTGAAASRGGRGGRPSEATVSTSSSDRSIHDSGRSGTSDPGFDEQRRSSAGEHDAPG